MAQRERVPFSAGSINRLLATCAAYHRRFGGWPTQARLDPVLLKGFAETMSRDEWERVTKRLELCTSGSLVLGQISVGGAGVVHCDKDVADSDWQQVDDVRRWLETAPVDSG